MTKSVVNPLGRAASADRDPGYPSHTCVFKGKCAHSLTTLRVNEKIYANIKAHLIWLYLL